MSMSHSPGQDRVGKYCGYCTCTCAKVTSAQCAIVFFCIPERFDLVVVFHRFGPFFPCPRCLLGPWAKREGPKQDPHTTEFVWRGHVEAQQARYDALYLKLPYFRCSNCGRISQTRLQSFSWACCTSHTDYLGSCPFSWTPLGWNFNGQPKGSQPL